MFTYIYMNILCSISILIGFYSLNIEKILLIRKLSKDCGPMELRLPVGYAGIMVSTAKPQAGHNQAIMFFDLFSSSRRIKVSLQRIFRCTSPNVTHF